MFDLIRQFPNEIEAYQSRPNPALLMNSKLVARPYVHPLGLCHGSTILAARCVSLHHTCGMTQNQLFSTFDTFCKSACQDATSLSSPFSSSLSSSLPVPSPSESPPLFFSLF